VTGASKGLFILATAGAVLLDSALTHAVPVLEKEQVDDCPVAPKPDTAALFSHGSECARIRTAAGQSIPDAAWPKELSDVGRSKPQGVPARSRPTDGG
jgi:hypothetical protein